MGAGGRMSSDPSGRKGVTDHVLVTKPPFTLGELKKAIPPHCFKRSLVRSFSTFLTDMVVISILFYVAANYIPLLPQSLAYLAWPVYWFCQGCVFMGLWILGHECGHHAFSDYQWIDDSVGFFVHSVTLTPYFSFKYSHASHHAHTNSLEYDEVYIPKRKSDTFYTVILNNFPGLVFTLALRLGLGFPLYLLFNIYGREYDSFANHYLPQSPIFTKRERSMVVLSDVGLLTVFYVLYRLIVAKGAAWVFCIYGAPMIVMSALFIVLTYLNHTHPALAHYDSTEWDWLRGALSTADRDFGILNKVFHDAPRTHLVHHLFSTIPHYHAMEAREAIRPILGDYYLDDSTPILKALWRDTVECVYVEPEGERKGIYWYGYKK